MFFLLVLGTVGKKKLQNQKITIFMYVYMYLKLYIEANNFTTSKASNILYMVCRTKK